MTDAIQPANNNSDSTEQTTLLEDSEFMLKFGELLRTIIRTELSSFTLKNQVKWETKPKGESFWNEAVARVKHVISQYGYATNQLLKAKDPWFNKVEFTYSAQIGRLFDRVTQNGEFKRFRLNNGNRAAWYITRKEWEPKAQRKAQQEKGESRCARVNWSKEVVESDEATNDPQDTPLGQFQVSEAKECQN